MTVKKIIFAPAKLNIFLKVLSKRDDGYHNIRTGITFINLYDTIEIEQSNSLSIKYTGNFSPKNGYYSDCIILRTMNFLNKKNDLSLNIKIQKNIPVEGGLGSASTNAASLILTLEEMNLIKKEDPKTYAILGADIPCFLFKKNCLTLGIGDIVVPQIYPKYYFLLVKPNFNNSTKNMYSLLDFNSLSKEITTDDFKINDEDFGNDFEKIVLEQNKKFSQIMEFLDNLDFCIFSRMTGTGSCCYAVFEKKEQAVSANKIFKINFKNLWSCVCENNI